MNLSTVVLTLAVSGENFHWVIAKAFDNSGSVFVIKCIKTLVNWTWVSDIPIVNCNCDIGWCTLPRWWPAFYNYTQTDTIIKKCDMEETGSQLEKSFTQFRWSVSFVSLVDRYKNCWHCFANIAQCMPIQRKMHFWEEHGECVKIYHWKKNGHMWWWLDRGLRFWQPLVDYLLRHAHSK